jgi:hypothetical protein
MAQKKIGVPMKESTSEYFCEMVRRIDRGVNAYEYYMVALHPVAQCKVFDINVSHPQSGFLGVAH